MRISEEALFSKQPVPQFMPSPRISHLRVINSVRQYLFKHKEYLDRDEIQNFPKIDRISSVLVGLPFVDGLDNSFAFKNNKEKHHQSIFLEHQILRDRYMGWSADSSATEEVIEYVEELVDLIKFLVGHKEFRYGFLARPIFYEWNLKGEQQFENETGTVDKVHKDETQQLEKNIDGELLKYTIPDIPNQGYRRASIREILSAKRASVLASKSSWNEKSTRNYSISPTTAVVEESPTSDSQNASLYEKFYSIPQKLSVSHNELKKLNPEQPKFVGSPITNKPKKVFLDAAKANYHNGKKMNKTTNTKVMSTEEVSIQDKMKMGYKNDMNKKNPDSLSFELLGSQRKNSNSQQILNQPLPVARSGVNDLVESEYRPLSLQFLKPSYNLNYTSLKSYNTSPKHSPTSLGFSTVEELSVTSSSIESRTIPANESDPGKIYSENTLKKGKFYSLLSSESIQIPAKNTRYNLTGENHVGHEVNASKRLSFLKMPYMSDTAPDTGRLQPSNNVDGAFKDLPVTLKRITARRSMRMNSDFFKESEFGI